jgi:hypothetical protein
MKTSLFAVLSVVLVPVFVSATSLESLKHAAPVSLPAAAGKILFAPLKALSTVGRSMTREELERLSDKELLLREMQLVREADAASLGEAYAWEEALVRIEEYARTSIPESDEAALASGVRRALSRLAGMFAVRGSRPRRWRGPISSSPAPPSRRASSLSSTRCSVCASTASGPCWACASPTNS